MKLKTKIRIARFVFWTSLVALIVNAVDWLFLDAANWHVGLALLYYAICEAADDAITEYQYELNQLQQDFDF